MNLSIAIVGLPNVGKSTLFNALLKKQQAFVANYPFATIEPNIGIVPVPDIRLQKLAEITKEEEKMDNLPPIKPAVVNFVDIAGLVKGAAVGEGLGNKFLSHIREADVICQVVRYFKDTNVVRSDSSTDAKNDFEVVNTELILADLQTLENQREPKNPSASSGLNKEDLLRWAAVEKLKLALNEGKLAKDVALSVEEKEAAKSLQLLTMKPMFIVANVDENALKEKYEENTIPVCAKIEAELSELSKEEQEEYLKSLGLKKSGLENIIEKGYEMLGLISFLTAGEKEIRAWTIKKVTTAVDAAGVIHTDFSKKFIKAEVVSFDDFVLNNGWKGARASGKARLEGRDYIVKDGDVVEFKIGS